MCADCEWRSARRIKQMNSSKRLSEEGCMGDTWIICEDADAALLATVLSDLTSVVLVVSREYLQGMSVSGHGHVNGYCGQHRRVVGPGCRSKWRKRWLGRVGDMLSLC